MKHGAVVDACVTPLQALGWALIAMVPTPFLAEFFGPILTAAPYALAGAAIIVAGRTRT